MIYSYDDAVNYLRSFIPFTLYNTDAYNASMSFTTGKTASHDPLDRMRVFLGFLENPEQAFRSILIGGTSGKGSTSYLIAHMLTTAGYKTGLTLSPHLVRINERIQLNGQEISDEDFVRLVNEVTPAVEQMKNTEYGVPSYFEITVGMAFLYFKQQEVDIAVVEIGMGGTYDATNVLQPLISVLTNISLDHTQFLGDTVEEIAKTKVGIIKKSQISNLKSQKLFVITGVTQSTVIEIVEKQCEEVGASLFRLGKDFQMTDLGLGLPGEYQKENASLAIETVKQLSKFGFSISNESIKNALNTAKFPGRFEIIHYNLEPRTYTLILDGAHNAAKMHAFVTSFKKVYPNKKTIFVIAFKKDKHIEEMVQEIIAIADTIIVTEFQIGTDTMISHAAMDSSEIQALIRGYGYSGSVIIEKDSTTALTQAMKQADAETIIAITGSLYLVGELKLGFFREVR